MTSVSADGFIGVYELKAHLSSVLEEVLAGRMITITRHGHPIACLQPVATSTERDRLEAVERIKAARVGVTLGMPIKDAINEGRR